MVPTDKAASNISIVCKKYYLEVIKDELENTPSYEKISMSTDDILSHHENDIYSEELDEDFKKLPYIYWHFTMLGLFTHLIFPPYIQPFHMTSFWNV